MSGMEWDRGKLEAYVSRWPELDRDIVFKEIIEAKFLKDALDLEGGRALLTDAVKIVGDKLLGLVALCDEYDLHPEKVRQAAIEVRTAQELLKRWAMVLTADAEHRRKANERTR